ncbi:sulfurtransferase [Evansella sp. LMS18]|uniref:sulfurtransferase n=1 Tax=Evansella sp. LMS18 TaxID=2924033 RepID=UPI0020D163D6|nr:sulfurtransferase [Evansella sp. LMS18]UTR10531.1 sulfurtransferase [Evansella sp. LMS18]
MSNVKSLRWLKENLGDPDIVIADCRFQLGEPEKGYNKYKEGHIPGAVYFDLEKELSAPISTHGGRHPLPETEQMAALFSKKGIDHTKQVIIYDDQGGAMASRLWWMLKYTGHNNAAILEEGFSAWREKGYPVTPEIPEPEITQYIPELNSGMLASAEDVKDSLHRNDVLLIDSRAEQRFTGETEPIDPVAGHIPGAVNEDWQNRLNENGKWKPAEEQAKELSKYNTDKNDVIVYCGSGVTACANVLAMEEAGIKPKLYAGSWSDWITYKDAPVETGHKNK